MSPHKVKFTRNNIFLNVVVHGWLCFPQIYVLFIFQHFECYTTLIVKELLYINKIIFYTFISKSVVTFMILTITNISDNIIKQYYGITFGIRYCNSSYYGEAYRHLKVRFREHIGIWPLKFGKVKPSKESAIRDHLLISNKIPYFDEFIIFAYIWAW